MGDEITAKLNMSPERQAAFLAEVAALVDVYRDRCLWFMREDYRPVNVDEALRALENIEKYGDAAAFEKIRRLRQCL